MSNVRAHMNAAVPLTICPRCEQGRLLAATVRHNGMAIRVCEECEATWIEPQEVDSRTFVDLGTYLTSLGRPPLWTELNLVEAPDQPLQFDGPDEK